MSAVLIMRVVVAGNGGGGKAKVPCATASTSELAGALSESFDDRRLLCPADRHLNQLFLKLPPAAEVSDNEQQAELHRLEGAIT